MTGFIMADNKSKSKILIVDDEPENIRILSKLLKDKCSLIVSSNGADALELAFSSEAPDLILLDIMMPEIDGYQVCKKLKQHPNTRDIPVIFITAKSESDDETKGFELGAVDYITKPFNPSIVEARVDAHLELRDHRLRLEGEVQARTRDFVLSESRLGSIINTFNGFVYACKRGSYQIDFMNQALMERFGEDTTKPCYELIFGFKQPCRLCGIEKVYQGQTVEVEIESFKDGRWYHILQSPVYAGDGTIEGRQAILIDITKRKLREMALEKNHKALEKENERLKAAFKGCFRFGKIIGKSEPMQEVYKNILKASASDASVIIYGESGTGKELTARAIHENSDRKKREMLVVNCGAIPENLLESEFFGHKKGAFTGADQDKKGFLELAHGSTLFLDEIAEIQRSLQVKLLRALEGSGFTRVGDTKIIQPDIRIIAATNRDVKEMVKTGLMREDFFYRLHVIPIYIPPLRKHNEDIPLLVEHFLKNFDSTKQPVISTKIMEALMHYQWPGNIRELQNTIQRFVTLNTLDLIGLDLADEDENDEIPELNGTDNLPLPAILEKIEQKIILERLNRHQWRRDKTAEDLGINRKALYRKMKQFGLIK